MLNKLVVNSAGLRLVFTGGCEIKGESARRLAGNFTYLEQRREPSDALWSIIWQLAENTRFIELECTPDEGAVTGSFDGTPEYLREVAGEAMAVPTGNSVKNHNGIFLLTETGALLWKLIESGTPENELVNKLTEEFDAPPETAQKDLDNFIKKTDRPQNTHIGVI